MERMDWSKMPIVSNIDASGIHLTQEAMEKAHKIALKHYQMGTITWYEIAKGELPPIPKTDECSDPVLIWAEGKLITQATYWFAEAGFFRHNSGNWQPTHWAFINNPELVKEKV
jgi:hypothetical protein